MLELGVGADLLRGVGFFVWVVFGLALLLALIKPKAVASKVLWSLLVIALFFGPMMPRAYENYVFKQRYVKAKALFDERCKIAGEKIYRTVDDVESVLLVNSRPLEVNLDRRNRDWRGAGFPGESGGDQYIMEFAYFNKPREGLRGRSLGPTPGGVKGYRYVYVDESGQRVRYSLRPEAEYSGGGDPVKGYGLREISKASTTKYSIVYENINDPVGREQWIAGGLVKVIDQSNGDLLAEFKRFSFEAGFGNTGGERSPWAFALQCPQSKYGGSSGHIRSFVEQVLKPTQGK